MQKEVEYLREMEKAGIFMKEAMQDDYAFLFTENEEVAKEYGLHEEEDYEEGDGFDDDELEEDDE